MGNYPNKHAYVWYFLIIFPHDSALFGVGNIVWSLSNHDKFMMNLDCQRCLLCSFCHSCTDTIDGFMWPLFFVRYFVL